MRAKKIKLKEIDNIKDLISIKVQRCTAKKKEGYTVESIVDSRIDPNDLLEYLSTVTAEIINEIIAEEDRMMFFMKYLDITSDKILEGVDKFEVV